MIKKKKEQKEIQKIQKQKPWALEKIQKIKDYFNK